MNAAEVVARGLHPAGAQRIADRLQTRHWTVLAAIAGHPHPVTSTLLTQAAGAPLDARHVAGLLRALAGDHLVLQVRPARQHVHPALWQATDRGRQVLQLRPEG